MLAAPGPTQALGGLREAAHPAAFISEGRNLPVSAGGQETGQQRQVSGVASTGQQVGSVGRDSAQGPNWEAQAEAAAAAQVTFREPTAALWEQELDILEATLSRGVAVTPGAAAGAEQRQQGQRQHSGGTAPSGIVLLPHVPASAYDAQLAQRGPSSTSWWSQDTTSSSSSSSSHAALVSVWSGEIGAGVGSPGAGTTRGPTLGGALVSGESIARLSEQQGQVQGAQERERGQPQEPLPLFPADYRSLPPPGDSEGRGQRLAASAANPRALASPQQVGASGATWGWPLGPNRGQGRADSALNDASVASTQAADRAQGSSPSAETPAQGGSSKGHSTTDAPERQSVTGVSSDGGDRGASSWTADNKWHIEGLDDEVEHDRAQENSSLLTGLKALQSIRSVRQPRRGPSRIIIRNNSRDNNRDRDRDRDSSREKQREAQRVFAVGTGSSVPQIREGTSPSPSTSPVRDREAEAAHSEAPSPLGKNITDQNTNDLQRPCVLLPPKSDNEGSGADTPSTSPSWSPGTHFSSPPSTYHSSTDNEGGGAAGANYGSLRGFPATKESTEVAGLRLASTSRCHSAPADESSTAGALVSDQQGTREKREERALVSDQQGTREKREERAQSRLGQEQKRVGKGQREVSSVGEIQPADEDEGLPPPSSLRMMDRRKVSSGSSIPVREEELFRHPVRKVQSEGRSGAEPGGSLLQPGPREGESEQVDAMQQELSAVMTSDAVDPTFALHPSVGPHKPAAASPVTAPAPAHRRKASSVPSQETITEIQESDEDALEESPLQGREGIQGSSSLSVPSDRIRVPKSTSRISTMSRTSSGGLLSRGDSGSSALGLIPACSTMSPASSTPCSPNYGLPMSPGQGAGVSPSSSGKGSLAGAMAGAGLTLVEILRSKMEQGDELGVSSAVELLCSLARKSAKWRIDITVAGGVPPLLVLLSDPTSEVAELSMKTLRNVSLERNTRPLLHAAGVTLEAGRILREGSTRSQHDAAATLFSLVKDDAVKKELGGTGGTIPLLAELYCSVVPASPSSSSAGTSTSSFSFQTVYPRPPLPTSASRPQTPAAAVPSFASAPTPETARLAVRILYYLSVYRPNKGRIVVTGVIPSLVQAIQGGADAAGAPDAAAAEDAVLLLSSLLCDPEAQREAVSCNCIPALTRLVQEGSPVAVEYAVWGLLQLAQAGITWCHVIAADGLSNSLVKIINSSSSSDRSQAKARELLKLTHWTISTESGSGSGVLPRIREQVKAKQRARALHPSFASID